MNYKTLKILDFSFYDRAMNPFKKTIEIILELN